jgi:hypothetical protein
VVSPVTSTLALGAAAIDGLLAGLNVDRMVVQMPAWRRVGVRAWAAYSRQADLRNGLFLYPAEGIGGTALSIATAVAVRLDAAGPREASLPSLVAAMLTIAGLAATVRAAPKMASLRRIDDGDDYKLQTAFDGFLRWGSVRAVCQVLAFAANLWTLPTLFAR